ncbi:XdhC family protein [Salipaludibacillus sp. HK11]|uniref:XdhC family protein n=1 Tax=Salipaludibacillus sp. HK11 TaxID=3394320 RepID=UPI0039FD4E2A
MKDQHKFLHIVKERPNQMFVLATVIRVDGSAYRHEGAKMLISETGEEFGLISGGCLEEDLSLKAQEVMESKQTQIISYDLRAEDDLGWGQGAGCNGKVTIYLEPLNWKKDSVEKGWSFVLEELEKGKEIVSIRFVGDNTQSGDSFFFKEDGECIQGISSLSRSNDMEVAHRQFIRSGEKFAYLDQEKVDNSLLFEVYEPKNTLYLFGAGRDVEPLVKRAAEFNFSTIIVDPRVSRNRKEIFPDASACVCEHPETFMENYVLKRNSYILIMTHSFSKDRFLLTSLLSMKEQLAYLGILGPTRRTKKLLNGKDIPSWLHSPIGIDIEAEGPEEISISVIAELIKTRNTRNLHRKEKLVVM